MTFFGDDDLATLIDDFGVPVVINGRSCKGLLDSTDQLAQAMTQAGSTVIGKHYVLTVPTTGLVVANGEKIVADGRSFIVKQKLAIDDGALTQLLLAKG